MEDLGTPGVCAFCAGKTVRRIVERNKRKIFHLHGEDAMRCLILQRETFKMDTLVVDSMDGPAMFKQEAR